jgi:methyl-accepting chemotaxis protein
MTSSHEEKVNMGGFRNWKLRNKVVIPALFVMISLSMALGGLIYRQQKQSAISQARQTAQSIAAQIAADRATYTERVVAKLQGEKADVVFADLKNVGSPKSLPLPATFVHLTSNIVNARGFHTVDLLSLWNINPDKKPSTDDIRKALEDVARTPDQIQEIVLDQAKDPRFISVSADLASAQGCVDCHNHHPDSKRHDFRLGDVMGGLVISIPLAKPLADAQNNALTLTAGLVGVFGLVLVLISLIQWTFISKPLLRLEKSADEISLGELDTPVVSESDDEVGSLAKAFERMRISLARAMESLDKE